MVTQSLIPTPLYGGAITVLLPPNLIDASSLRQIPDNQEVFLQANSTVSIIVSLLEALDASDDLEALKIHFDDNIGSASDRDGNIDLAVRLSDVGGIPISLSKGEGEGEVRACMCVASMRTSEAEKGRQRAKGEEEVEGTGIVMGLIRLAKVKTDVVVMVSVPFVKGEFDESLVDWTTGVLDDRVEAAKGWVIDGLVKEFKVNDWGLFGEE